MSKFKEGEKCISVGVKYPVGKPEYKVVTVEIVEISEVLEDRYDNGETLYGTTEKQGLFGKESSFFKFTELALVEAKAKKYYDSLISKIMHDIKSKIIDNMKV